MIRNANGCPTTHDGATIPKVVSCDPEFVRLVRNIQRFRNTGRMTDDEALASIAELVDVVVEAAFMPGAKRPVDFNAYDTDEESERALNHYISNIYSALGEPAIARLFLEERDEFERRNEAGTSLKENVLT